MGVLSVVGTPIGNLGDLTRRAEQTLRDADAIVCEDTRVTRKLLSAYGIDRPVVAYHAHSGPDVLAALVARLGGGERLALVTDAGTPGLSDPGGELVAAAAAAGIEVVAVPGPSALAAAVSIAGIPVHPLLFLGFLPRAEGARRELLAPHAAQPWALGLYESPHRLQATLQSLRACLGDRRAVVARELTKRFETVVRGRLSELEASFAEGAKGEIVILVAPPEATEAAAPALDARAEARRLLDAGLSPKDVAAALAGAHGLRRQDAYRLVLEVRTAE